MSGIGGAFPCLGSVAQCLYPGYAGALSVLPVGALSVSWVGGAFSVLDWWRIVGVVMPNMNYLKMHGGVIETEIPWLKAAGTNNVQYQMVLKQNVRKTYTII